MEPPTAKESFPKRYLKKSTIFQFVFPSALWRTTQVWVPSASTCDPPTKTPPPDAATIEASAPLGPAKRSTVVQVTPPSAERRVIHSLVVFPTITPAA